MRLGEAMELEWSRVDLDARDAAGEKAGEIYLAGVATKTHKARTVGLEVSPALRKLLAAMHLASGGKGKVFPLTRGTIDAAAKRLRDEYGAAFAGLPSFVPLIPLPEIVTGDVSSVRDSQRGPPSVLAAQSQHLQK
jgi:hypothetical protein